MTYILQIVSYKELLSKIFLPRSIVVKFSGLIGIFTSFLADMVACYKEFSSLRVIITTFHKVAIYFHLFFIPRPYVKSLPGRKIAPRTHNVLSFRNSLE